MIRRGSVARRPPDSAPTTQQEEFVELFWPYVRGLAIGFAIAAAIGPIGLLCIRRTLTEGPAIGAVSGLGAATADALYASIAAFGLTAVADLLVGARRPLGIVGGAFLVALAVHSLLSRPQAAADRPPRTLLSAYATTVGLTIANPATILSFAAAFVGLGLAGHDAPTAAALVLGIFSGSSSWWLFLAVVVSAFRDRLGPAALGRLAAGSSILIGALGLVAIGASLAA
jgi:threonine/homoserine/homoserine lactone efflux protein